ncbi:DDE-type integrase/transposase/recombinase [Verrucomicrobiota bacterium]
MMKNPSPYLKMRVMGAIDLAQGKSIRARIKQVSKMTFEDEDGNQRRFTWRTIQTWFYRFKVSGITSMQSKPRSDKGKPRKVHPEKLLEAVEEVLPSFRGRHFNKGQIYRACIERGLLRREDVAPNTFRRLCNELELLKSDSQVQNKRRQAFSKQYANEMWQADTMFGPYVKKDSTSVQTKLICFLDDASRVVCHGEFFFSENIDSLIKALRSALYKRGIPESMYVDNGSIYTSKEIVQICARLGCLLCHAPLRDGAAKGKVERFFRTVRGDFLSRQLDLSSLQALNRAFTSWVEDEYHTREHSTLKMCPIDRFGINLQRIRFLPPNEANDELFYVEESRYVKNDNTFSLRSIRFEAPRHLPNRKVQVRFDRPHFDRVVVFYKAQRMGEARPVDYIANDRKPSKGDLL